MGENMPNRTLQAKELKRKKQRRLFPKQLGAGYISVGSRFNKELASVSRGRVSGRAFDEEFNRYIDAKTVKNVTASVESIAAEEAALRIHRAQLAARQVVAACEVMRLADQSQLLSKEHFSVDGTLIQAWASHKSMRRKDGSDDAGKALHYMQKLREVQQ